jgi:hypothetical protein
MVPEPESRAGSSPTQREKEEKRVFCHPWKSDILFSSQFIHTGLPSPQFSMALRTCITVLATLGLATAQSSIVSLFIPDSDPQPLAASVVGQVSTYALVEILKLN